MNKLIPDETIFDLKPIFFKSWKILKFVNIKKFQQNFCLCYCLILTILVKGHSIQKKTCVHHILRTLDKMQENLSTRRQAKFFP